MADFCRQCALEYGFDPYDMALSKEHSFMGDDLVFGVICEGCGNTQVDCAGQCVGGDCLANHDAPDKLYLSFKSAQEFISKEKAEKKKKIEDKYIEDIHWFVRDNMDMLSNPVIRECIEEILNELSGARSKHPPFPSLYHGYAVMLKEVDELWEAIKGMKQGGKTSIVDVRTECIQVASSAVRFLSDLYLFRTKKRKGIGGDIEFPAPI